MDLIEILGNASLVGLLSLLVGVSPLVAAVAYVAKPTEQRLALMRPVSLAGIFAALTGTTTGFINVLRMIAISEAPVPSRIVALSAAEALVPLLVAFGCLMVSWLCVAVGLRRA